MIYLEKKIEKEQDLHKLGIGPVLIDIYCVLHAGNAVCYTL